MRRIHTTRFGAMPMILALSFLALGCSTEGSKKVAPPLQTGAAAKGQTPAKQPVPAEAVKQPAPAAAAMPAPAAADSGKPLVVIETSMGTIKAELWLDKAPITVANFLGYVDERFYDGLIFHRVMDGFMIQGGGFTPDMQQKAARPAIKNEARADVPNSRGTLAMARTPQIDSATAQFFINLVDNTALNHRDDSPAGFGYCVFGKVVEGMDVVNKIAKVGTTNYGPHANVPAQPVVIKTIRRAD